MTKNEAIFKIRKLLALSKSPNENEAALALQKAMELMESFGLEENEVRYTSVRPKTRTERSPRWKTTVARTAGTACGVLHVKDLDSWVFCGPDFKTDVAAEMYDYLCAAILRLARANIRKNAKYKFRESYRYGAAVRIYQRIIEMNGEVWLSNSSKQIELIEEAFSKDLALMKKKKKSTNPAAFSKGMRDGESIGLNRQTGGYAEPQKKLGAV